MSLRSNTMTLSHKILNSIWREVSRRPSSWRFPWICLIHRFQLLIGYQKTVRTCAITAVLTVFRNAKAFADELGVAPENIIVGGASSLNLMYDYISQCYTHGAGAEPWCRQGDVKFICNVPGYDRHFGICEHFGIKMINVRMTETGPDVAKITELVKDPSVKGMFCVPKYSNPDGITYSDETVRALAALKPSAPDFRVIWDNAYIVHDLCDDADTLLNILMPARNSEQRIISLNLLQHQNNLPRSRYFGNSCFTEEHCDD